MTRNPEVPVRDAHPGTVIARVGPDLNVEWATVVTNEPIVRDGRTVAYRLTLDNGEDFRLTSRRRVEVQR